MSKIENNKIAVGAAPRMTRRTNRVQRFETFLQKIDPMEVNRCGSAAGRYIIAVILVRDLRHNCAVFTSSRVVQYELDCG